MNNYFLTSQKVHEYNFFFENNLWYLLIRATTQLNTSVYKPETKPSRASCPDISRSTLRSVGDGVLKYDIS